MAQTRICIFVNPHQTQWDSTGWRSTHLEAIRPAGHVHAGNVGQIGELRIVVVLQEGQHRHNALRTDEDLQLVAGRQLGLLHVLGQTVGDHFAKVGERAARHGVRLANGGCGRDWRIICVSQSATQRSGETGIRTAALRFDRWRSGGVGGELVDGHRGDGTRGGCSRNGTIRKHCVCVY